MGVEKRKLSLAEPIKKALTDMAYGENASESQDVIKMTLQSAINRYLSGKQEFGKGPGMYDILNQGYYAVQNNTPLYQQAATGEFPDSISEDKYYMIQKTLEDILKTQDYGDVMWYFKPDEIEKKPIDFNKVRSTGEVGPYKTYSY